MDPGTIALLVSVLGSAAAGMGGKDEKHGSTYNKGQRSQIDQLLESLKGMQGSQDINQNPEFQTGQDWLQSMFNDPEFFNQFEAPIKRQFEEETIPNLANRFASMGSGGSTGSTAFRNQLGREGSNLSTNLAAMRGQMQSQAIPQLLQYGQQPFQNYMTMMQQALQPTNNTYQPASAGFFGPVAAAATGGVAQGAGQAWGQNMANGRFPGQSPSTY